jgi:hypothetical protein
VPLRWTVETSRATPAQFEAYQGETLDLEATLQSSGKPLALSGIAAFYWQTNGMGSAYWEATAAVNSNRLSAVWTPEMDVGARVYNCFIGQPGKVYRAAFQLRLRPSPGATPNVLPLPVPVIDFARVRVLNPPWGSGGGASIDFDAEPTEGSQNAARSGGIWSWVKRLVTGKLDKSGGTLTGGITFEGEQFGIKFNDNHQSISFSNGNNIGQYGLLIQGKPINYPSASGTLALTSDIPEPYTPPPYLRSYDEVRQCWWLGKMVNGVINWEVE